MSGEKKVPGYMKFVLGGSAGMLATCFVQPLDLIKNRVQLAKDSKQSVGEIIRGIIKNEGLLAFYNGLSAGLLRQATYTTTRLGIYTWIFELASQGGVPPSAPAKAAMAIFAGAIGAFVGTPAEVSLIRMTSDGRLPPDQRRNYKNVFDAILRILKEEGIRGLWRGATPTIGRAMVVNAAQLATYSQAKEMYLKTGLFNDDLLLYFCSSMTSGLVTTITSMPVDIAKTRLQNMKTVDGKTEYSGTVDVLTKIIKNEGVFSLWKGFFPYLFRIGPHTVLTFIFLENLTAAYKKYVLGIKSKGGSTL